MSLCFEFKVSSAHLFRLALSQHRPTKFCLLLHNATVPAITISAPNMERMLAEAHTKLEILGFTQAKIEKEYDDIERTVKEISAWAATRRGFIRDCDWEIKRFPQSSIFPRINGYLLRQSLLRRKTRCFNKCRGLDSCMMNVSVHKTRHEMVVSKAWGAGADFIQIVRSKFLS